MFNLTPHRLMHTAAVAFGVLALTGSAAQAMPAGDVTIAKYVTSTNAVPATFRTDAAQRSAETTSPDGFRTDAAARVPGETLAGDVVDDAPAPSPAASPKDGIKWYVPVIAAFLALQVAALIGVVKRRPLTI